LCIKLADARGCRIGPFDHIAVKGNWGLNAGDSCELQNSL
jgi:hypothetical protein